MWVCVYIFCFLFTSQMNTPHNNSPWQVLSGMILSLFFAVFFPAPLFIIAFFNSFFKLSLLKYLKNAELNRLNLHYNWTVLSVASISVRSVSCVLHHQTESSNLLLLFSNIILVFKIEKRFKEDHKNHRIVCSSLSVIKNQESIYQGSCCEGAI